MVNTCDRKEIVMKSSRISIQMRSKKSLKLARQTSKTASKQLLRGLRDFRAHWNKLTPKLTGRITIKKLLIKSISHQRLALREAVKRCKPRLDRST